MSQRLYCPCSTLLSGPHLPLSHPASGSGERRQNAGKRARWVLGELRKGGCRKDGGMEGHNFKGTMLSKCFIIPAATQTRGDQQLCRCSAHAGKVLGMNIWVKGRASWRKWDHLGERRDCRQVWGAGPTLPSGAGVEDGRPLPFTHIFTSLQG